MYALSSAISIKHSNNNNDDTNKKKKKKKKKKRKQQQLDNTSTGKIPVLTVEQSTRHAPALGINKKGRNFYTILVTWCLEYTAKVGIRSKQEWGGAGGGGGGGGARRGKGEDGLLHTGFSYKTCQFIYKTKLNYRLIQIHMPI